ncbi:MAG: PLP-dependent aminotransferase family protein [Bacteroidales bacterium]|nr:PLP-dependent aminotransferase family protein [Bacteroidales bacterium]
MANFLRSPVREIFRRVDLNAICSFAGGYPDAATFPLDEMQGLAARVVSKYGSRALQYGATQGVPELRQALFDRYLSVIAGSDRQSLANIQITTSSQQGIDVCSRILLDPGDAVLAFSPVYLGALQSFRSYRAEVVDLALFLGAEGEATPFGSSPYGLTPPPASAGGPPATELWVPGKSTIFWDQPRVLRPSGSTSPSALKKARFIYVIPDFNNPSGETLSLERRKQIVEFARKNDLLIVEDSPYRELRYSGEELPTIYSMAPERTLHLGSFSKIFAPGFRLGWIFGPEEILDKIYVCKQALDLCPPVFDQYLAAEFLTSGALDANLAKSRELYRAKRDLMLSLLDKYMPEGVSWTRPEGGLFLWLTLPESIDTVALYDRALAAGVAYVAGSFFYPDGSHRNTMRLNFSFLDSSRMEEGVRLLASLLK